MKKAELVFIPSPSRGHLVSMIEFAKILVDRDDRFLITVLIIKLPYDPKLVAYTNSLIASSASDRIKFVDLSQDDIAIFETNPLVFMDVFIENHKPRVKNAVTELAESYSSRQYSVRLAGFVIDMLMTTMIDVANEFEVPTYVFYTSSAGCLSLNFMVPAEFSHDPGSELAIPSFVNPIPKGVLPCLMFDEASTPTSSKHARRLRETKGVIVNTFMELESHAVHSLLRHSESPTVYPVGPIINHKDNSNQFISTNQHSDIIDWLDGQPRSSVVFLCFGSMGCFGEDQVREIARALEQGEFHFLWSLREPPKDHKLGFPNDYTDPSEALPEGFLDRTARRGKVISWAPQVAVLSHPAIGGFVSHCGWNSILESLWFGVPVATWPLFWEQQLNAFEMVKELGLAIEIRMDYVTEFYCKKEPKVVRAQEIEERVRKLMEDAGSGNDVRKRVKEMSEKIRKALMVNGSSYSSLSRFISDIMDNIR